MTDRATMRLLCSVLALAAAIVCLSAHRAEAALYWGSNGSIGAVNTDGSMLIDSYPYGVANTIPQASTCGVAVSATHLFWADGANGAIGSMALTNTPDGRIEIGREPYAWIDQALVPGVPHPCGVAVDAGHLYWSSIDGTIGRSNLDGSAPDRTFIAGLGWPCGLAVDAGHIYWGEAEARTIARARLDGSDVEPEFVADTGGVACGVAVDANHVYWSSQEPNAIGRADLDGGNPDPTFIPLGERSPCGVAVDTAHIYWADWNESGAYVSRAGIDGSGASLLAGEQFYGASCGVALDSRTFVPRPPPNSAPLRFGLGHLKRLKHGRVLVLPVYVPDRGELNLLSPKIGWSLDKGPERPAYVHGVFRWKLTLWPGGGPAGKRIRRQLRRSGRVPVSLHFQWQQEGRAAAREGTQLAFLAPR